MKGPNGEVHDVSVIVKMENVKTHRGKNKRDDAAHCVIIGRLVKEVNGKRIELRNVQFRQSADSKFHLDPSASMYENTDNFEKTAAQIAAQAMGGGKPEENFYSVFEQIRDASHLDLDEKGQVIEDMIIGMFRTKISKAKGREFSSQFLEHSSDGGGDTLSDMSEFQIKIGGDINYELKKIFSEEPFNEELLIEEEYMEYINRGIDRLTHEYYSIGESLIIDTPDLDRIN